MRRIAFLIIALLAVIPAAVAADNSTNREQRKLIMKGNGLYRSQKYDEAFKVYSEVLKKYPGCPEASYNYGLTMLQLAAGKDIDEEKRQKYVQEGASLMEASTKFGSTRPELASRANYNLGNLAVANEQLPQAAEYYKEALRLNPADDNARHNLRIVQLKMQNNKDQNNDKDKNKDKNKDQNKDQNKDKDKNKEQNQNQDKNQDKNKDKQDQQQQPQQPQQPQERMSDEAAKQILQAMENKENQIRAAKAKNARQGGRPARKNW